MKKFDLEKALAGASVVMRDGREVTELHYFKTVKNKYCLVAVVNGCIQKHYVNGIFLNEETASKNDLFIKSKKQNIED